MAEDISVSGFEESVHAIEHDLFRAGLEKVGLQTMTSGKDKDMALFFGACHEGFARGQEKILEGLLPREAALHELKTELKKARRQRDRASVEAVEFCTSFLIKESSILRKLADTLAWIALGQRWMVRRLYLGHDQPVLAESNYQSVQAAAGELMKDPLRFALMTDLTSFVQIGDLLVTERNRGGATLRLVEVKTGERNAEVREFVNFFYESGCQRAYSFFAKEYGKTGEKHAGRMMRQDARMATVLDSLTEEKGEDLSTGTHFEVHQEPIELATYDEVIPAMEKECASEGSALEVVDDCLVVGMYKPLTYPRPLLTFYHDLFHCLQPDEECPDPEQVDTADLYRALKPPLPVTPLINGIRVPLSMPIFLRPLGNQLVNDILFGRRAVFAYLDLDRFLALASQRGLEGVWLTRKQVGRRFKGRPPGLIEVGGKFLAFTAPGTDHELLTGDGLLVQMIYDGVSPKSALEIVSRSLKTASS